EIRRRKPNGVERLAGSLHREVRRGDVRISDVALPDACSLQNPLVGRLNDLFKILVCQHSRRHVAPERADLCSAHKPSHSTPGWKQTPNLLCYRMESGSASTATV